MKHLIAIFQGFLALSLLVIAGHSAALSQSPVCDAVGSRSEGWYHATLPTPGSSRLIMWAQECSGCTAVCSRIGTQSEGWYSSCSDTLILLAACGESAQDSGFSDVSAGHPNHEAIAYVRAQGIVSGYSDGTYRPDQQINRAEFAKILEESIPLATNGVGICPPNPGDYESFSDVRGDDWFWIYVCMQEGRGIIDGYPDGTFRPANLINFAEAAKMLYGANHLDDRGILLSSNVEGQPWFRLYVAFLEEQHAIPTSITRFDQPIARGEMAEMIYRLRSNKKDLPSTTYEQLAKDSKSRSALVHR